MAREAGVSLATASKALNGRPDVGEATRVKVVEVAERLEFAPNLQARSLMSGRTGTVGLLSTDLEGRFGLPIMLGAEDALEDGEAVAIMVNSRGREELQRKHLAALLARRVDGLIVVGDRPEVREPLVGAAHLPVVYAYAPSSGPDDVSFIADHRGAGRIATEHLLDRGCRRIAHLGGPLGDAVGATAAELRALGTADVLRDRDLAMVRGGPLVGDWTEQWGWTAVDLLLDAGTAVDGLVCANDQIARGAIDCLLTRGVRVPEDVAVIGFDNWAPVAALARLPQSSVDANLHELGRAAARAVLADSLPEPGQHLLPGRLVVRESSAG